MRAGAERLGGRVAGEGLLGVARVARAEDGGAGGRPRGKLVAADREQRLGQPVAEWRRRPGRRRSPSRPCRRRSRPGASGIGFRRALSIRQSASRRWSGHREHGVELALGVEGADVGAAAHWPTVSPAASTASPSPASGSTLLSDDRIEPLTCVLADDASGKQDRAGDLGPRPDQCSPARRPRAARSPRRRRRTSRCPPSPGPRRRRHRARRRRPRPEGRRGRARRSRSRPVPRGCPSSPAGSGRASRCPSSSPPSGDRRGPRRPGAGRPRARSRRRRRAGSGREPSAPGGRRRR